MPFTFAHASAVLPIKSKKFDLSALILGSMAPDFIYFILFNPSSNFGHSYAGFILFNLPMCLLINYLFYRYIQETFIYSMPKCISDRYMYMTMYKNKICNAMDFWKFTYSALIGMLTHVFWDSFTHSTGFFVVNVPLLNESINILNMDIPLYKILQHGSTVIGFLIIFIYFYNVRDKSGKSYNIRIDKKRIWLSLISIFVLTMILSIVVFIKLGLFIGIGRIVVTIINSVFISYVITGMLFKEHVN